MRTKEFKSGKMHLFIKFNIPELNVQEERYRWYRNPGSFIAALYAEYRRRFPDLNQGFFIQVVTLAEIVHLEDGREEWRYVELEKTF